MRNLFLLTVFAIVTAVIWLPQDTADKVNAPVPDFFWQTLDDKEYALTDYQGKPLVIHFWASWCIPCREEFPTLIEAARANSEIIFLTLSSDAKRTDMEAFLKQMQGKRGALPSNMLLGWDPKKSVTFDVFQTARYPESFLVDKNHRIKRKFAEPVDWSRESVKRALAEIAS